MKNKNNLWNFSDNQYKMLQNCSKINSILYFNGNNDVIISTNALDESFTIFYLNRNFKFDMKKEFVIHNINEVLKTIKMIEKGNIYIEDDRIVISDSEEKIKCKYLYANIDMIENIKKVYENYNDILTSIKEDDNVIKINFSKEYFENIKKFLTSNFNTISITNNKITLFDSTGSSNLDIKDNVEIELKDATINGRFDIDITLFKSIEENNYDCYLSPSGFVLFENNETGNIYGIATNIIE